MATLQLFTSVNNKLVLSKTTTYSYRTKDIYLITILDTIPATLSVGFYIYNATNVNITVTPLLNVFPDASLPDVLLTTTATIDANTAQFITIPSQYLTANYVSVNIKPTASATGYVTGFAIVNYNYTTK